MEIQELLKRLDGVKENSKGWMALCPAHDDHNPSLHVAVGGDGKILLKCFAGCTTEQICSKLGLELQDLFPDVTRETLAKGKALSVDFLIERFGLGNTKLGNRNAVLIPYFDVDKNLIAKRYRTGIEGENRFKWEKGSKVIPYGLWLLNGSKEVVLVEGESDTWTLAFHNFPVLGIPGKGSFKPDWAKYLEPFQKIYVWQEPGAQDFPARIQQVIKRDICVLDAEKTGAKDPSDLHVKLTNEKKDFRAEFQRLLDTAEFREWRPEQSPTEPSVGRKSQADIVIEIVKNEAQLFHEDNDNKDTWAIVSVNSHKEVWPIRSKQFRFWVAKRFYEAQGKSVNNEALRQAYNVIESFAIFDQKPRKLHIRVAKRDGAIYYDLANEKWEAVKVENGEWKIVSNPLLFKRYKNTAKQVYPQKVPVPEINLLRKYINVSDDIFIILVAYLVFCFISDLPHPILTLYGDKGSAKTTTMRLLRSLIDPAVRDTFVIPHDKNDLALMLTTNYMPAFDNLDSLNAMQSDALCQACTGGGISKRELYTDIDEVILSFKCCPVLNGINLVAQRDDLLDRAILIKLDRIDPLKRLPESVLWANFEQDKPKILGAILEILAKAQTLVPSIKLTYLPRMADFAIWGYAVSQVLYGNGEVFLKAYMANVDMAVEESILADIVGYAVSEFMKTKTEWTGTPSELHAELAPIGGYGFPKTPQALTRRLNKIKSALTDYGILVREERTKSRRIIHLSALVRVGEISSQPSPPSQPTSDKASQGDDKKILSSPPLSLSSPEPPGSNRVTTLMTDDDNQTNNVIANQSKTLENDDDDANDDKIPISTKTSDDEHAKHRFKNVSVIFKEIERNERKARTRLNDHKEVI